MEDQSFFTNERSKLKTYYAIFTSACLGLYVLLLIFEQLGTDRITLSYYALFFPIAITVLIGIAGATRNNYDYFVVSRKVPAAYSGLTMAFTSLGSAGFLGYIGVLFFLGFDGLAIGLGWALGFTLLAFLFAPYIRKMGAFTLPGFFAIRYNSRMLRLTTSSIVIIISCMLLIVELQIGAFVASLILDVSQSFLMTCGIILISLYLIAGGMRSLTWSQCAQYIVTLIALFIPLTLVALQLTNLPLPQLTYGRILDNLQDLEIANNLNNIIPTSLSSAFPTNIPTQIIKPFEQQFGAITNIDFCFLIITIMLGVAALPSLYIRISTTPNVSQARRSVAWGLAFVGLFLISAPAYAVFTKFILLQNLPQLSFNEIPNWLSQFEKAGMLSFNTINSSDVDLNAINFSRDSIFFILPQLVEFPYGIILLCMVGIIMLAIANVSAHIITVSHSLSHDLLYCLANIPATKKGQTATARFCIIITATLGLTFALSGRLDSLEVLLWMLSLSASSFFAPLALTIWWSRCSQSGVLWGILSGFCISSLYIWLSNDSGLLFGISGHTAAIIGVPISLAVTVIVSLQGQTTKKTEIQNLIEDIRIPGGEALYNQITYASGKRRKIL